uniref:Major facilitator superfamily domain containing 4Aa n=1 Tax=Salarias fasciatus TaxID=181472 RepID=A0A672G4C9_SALFA
MQLADERIRRLLQRHWRQTLTYWSVFFSFGLCVAFLGPTILDLRCQTRTSLQQITWVFFSQQLFLLLGSSVGGLFHRTLLSSLLALFFCTFIISLVFAVIPLCHDVMLLSVAMALAGKAMGVIDTIANVELVKLYQKDAAIFLQALHCFIGLGALVSPLVAEPFLAEDSCVLGANWTADPSPSSDLDHLRSSLVGQGATLHNISQYPLHTSGVVVTRVSYAFWIMALINVGVTLVHCLLLTFYTSSVFLFVGTCVLGVCISSVFPSMLAFTEDILNYQGCATTVLVTSAGTGEMTLQLLVGSVKKKNTFSHLNSSGASLLRGRGPPGNSTRSASGFSSERDFIKTHCWLFGAKRLMFQ